MLDGESRRTVARAVLNAAAPPRGDQTAPLPTQASYTLPPTIGEHHTQAPPPQHAAARLWMRPARSSDPHQYDAIDDERIRADPILRLGLRDVALEEGPGVVVQGIRVVLDGKERTVMREADGGATRGDRVSADAMRAAIDLHARHHFTVGAACDGSLKEEVLATGGMRRRLAYGVWTGVHGGGWRSTAAARGIWGGRIESDGEIADAELYAIHEVLRRAVAESAQPENERLFIASDSLGCLDSLEGVWRQGDARGMRTRERAAMLESCCVLRARLQLVVFMYVPAHRGISLNAYADAAAKAHLDAPLDADTASTVCENVTSKPSVHVVRSDFCRDGTLRAQGVAATDAPWVVWDKRLFAAVRRRAARSVHERLHAKHAEKGYVDSTWIGRRAHESESRSYADVARRVFQCV